MFYEALQFDSGLMGNAFEPGSSLKVDTEGGLSGFVVHKFSRFP